MDYKNTIFLPSTAFPMRGNLGAKEPEILKYWEEINIYQKRCESSKKEKQFILHDGPPFANGVPHAGTSLNRVLKDIVLRMKWMNGYYAPFTPGWDCHGLPIEWKVEENLSKEGKDKNDIGIPVFREMCADFAKYWIGVQKEGFQRLGGIGDWERPYLTMNHAEEAEIARLIGEFLLDGTMYEGEKPVYWSIVEKTALAEAEIEYKGKTSSSIYLAFPIKTSNSALLKDAKIVIWTTTPWTIPANRAISYADDARYVVVQTSDFGKLVVAEDLLEEFSKNVSYNEVIGRLESSDISGTICFHPLYKEGYDFDVPLLCGEHVTLDTGTGFVHTAPGHGLEDFEICKKHNIPVPKSVNEEGRYYDTIPIFAGMHIFKDEHIILDKLSESKALLACSKVTHSYPHSWRSKSPLIFRTTPQWFISLDKTGLRQKALREIDKVKWIPAQGYNRIKSFIENRGDWCISRQRVWGVPLPIFVNKKTSEPLIDREVINRVSEIFKEEGTNSWYTRDPQDFLGEKYDSNDYIQSQDTIDVWFDSSCSHSYVLRSKGYDKADLYLEGSDQHRGWFQHSLLVSCCAYDQAPFKAVLTHGFTIDEQGKKMSKSIGNTINLPELVDKVGADIFRMWVASSDYTTDLKLGDNIIRQCQENYKKLRNTIRYMLGVLNDNSEIQDVLYRDLPDLEKYIMHKIYDLDGELRECAEKYDINRYFSLINTFCNNELSSYFFDIRKDRLYCDNSDDLNKIAYVYAIKTTFDFIVRWLSPILAFTCEEAWLTLYKSSSVHLQEYLIPPVEWNNRELYEKMTFLKYVRKIITEALEVSRQSGEIGSSLQADVTVFDPDKVVDGYDIGLLKELSIVSELKLSRDELPEQAYKVDNIGIVISVSNGEKCERCWKFDTDINNGLCERCRCVLKI